MIAPRAAYRVSLGAGLVILCLAVMSFTREPIKPCGDLGSNYSPVTAFELSASPDIASNWLSLLTWVTEVKWVGLGIAGVVGGCVLAKRAGWRLLALVPCVPGLVVALITIPRPSVAGPYLALAVVLGWAAFLVVDVRESFRRDSVESV